MTEPEREAFLGEPRVAVLSVPRGPGQPPLTTPSFYAYEPGGDVTFFTGTQGRRARKIALIHAAGVLSLSVQHPDPPSPLHARRPRPGAGGLRARRPRERARRLHGPPERWLTADFSDLAG